VEHFGFFSIDPSLYIPKKWEKKRVLSAQEALYFLEHEMKITNIPNKINNNLFFIKFFLIIEFIMTFLLLIPAFYQSPFQYGPELV